jgi:hypothetical protein
MILGKRLADNSRATLEDIAAQMKTWARPTLLA